MRVALPAGAVVQAFGLSGTVIDASDHRTPDWALYLDEQWRDREREWPCRLVDWPDFGLPADEEDAFDAIVEANERASKGEVVDVACDGGTGRTGTVLACLAVIDGVDADAAVRWVRSNYHPWSVEVEEQEQLIGRFASRVRRSG